jgi:hypothetical protein
VPPPKSAAGDTTPLLRAAAPLLQAVALWPLPRSAARDTPLLRAALTRGAALSCGADFTLSLQTLRAIALLPPAMVAVPSRNLDLVDA